MKLGTHALMPNNTTQVDPILTHQRLIFLNHKGVSDLILHFNCEKKLCFISIAFLVVYTTHKAQVL